jgi:hypothetical protein
VFTLVQPSSTQLTYAQKDGLIRPV